MLVKLFLLRWFISWCTLIQGLIGVLTFGRYWPSIELWAAKKYSSAKFISEHSQDVFMEVTSDLRN